MNIFFPRGIVVDTNNIPTDFEARILEAFKDYTRGTNPCYMYQDKLSFIDCCVKHLHKAHNSDEAVKGQILRNVEWELDEYGELPEADEFWDIGFMCQCYDKGKKDASLYDHYTGNHYIDDVIMNLLVRAIKVVINYDGGGAI